ncbi:hypothetical protein IKQ26_02580 [bacterium]|nr:hypothetical protein [bacterium]
MITLVIIGVIAAITVPTLMNKTNNQEYVTRLKKAYSTLSQVTNRILIEEGKPRAVDGGWLKSNIDFYNMYRKYLVNAKECGSENGCFEQTYKSLDGTRNVYYNNDTGHARLILADGVQILFDGVGVNSLDTQCRRGLSDVGSVDVCTGILVDVNGARKPNVFGRDLFYFVLKENGLYPAGCDDPGYCNGPSATFGWGCACKVIREGKIDY